MKLEDYSPELRNFVSLLIMYDTDLEYDPAPMTIENAEYNMECWKEDGVDTSEIPDLTAENLMNLYNYYTEPIRSRNEDEK